MTTIIFCIVAVILTTLIIIIIYRLGKLKNYYSDLLNKLLETNGNISKHKTRIDAHDDKIEKNKNSINDIKDGDLFKINKQLREHDEFISKIEKVVFIPTIDPTDEASDESSSATSAEQTAAEDDKPADRDRAERAPYPEEVRTMAENLIKAEYGKSSYRVMSNLLQIPVTTVKRWTKQLIQKGELTPKQVAAAEHAE